MNHVNKERVKSIIIIVLFVLSLLQVGILWVYQSHRLPISFLAGIFGGSQIQVSDKMTRDELFVPYRLVVSNGDSSHWTLDRSNPIFKTLWNETKTYLNSIAEGGLTNSGDSSGAWGDITSRAGFVFEFKEGLSPELVKWFTGNPNSQVELPVVYKIMVIPDNNEGSSTLYIYNMKEQVFEYKSAEYNREKSFKDILAVFEQEDQKTYRELITMHDSNLEKKLDVEPDLLYVVKPDSWPYNTINAAPPADLNNMDKLAETMLGSEKERYSQTSYDDGTIQFSNTDNIYKIYSHGALEYKYLSVPNPQDQENVGTALLNAYGFVKKAVSLTDSKADIYLSGAEKTASGAYRFKFDYLINGEPVYIQMPGTGNGENTVANAITVEANSKRVINGYVVLRDFSISGKSNYNDRFLEIMKTSPLTFSQVQIKDIGVGYVIGSENDRSLKPVMVIENKGVPGIQAFAMPEQKGD